MWGTNELPSDLLDVADSFGYTQPQVRWGSRVAMP